MSTIDLSQLPPPDVVETIDYETILADRKAELIGLYPEDQQDAIAATLTHESEPLTKLLEENAYRETIWRQRVNEAARGVMIAFARGDDLDQLAANYDVERLLIDPGDPDAIPPVPPTYESDRDLRARIPNAFEGLSVAGPRASYEFHARSADGRVADVTAISPTPAAVTVTVLSTEDDGTASQDLLDTVEAALSDDDIRPVGDRLTVQSATITDYQVEATLYIRQGPESEPIMQAAQDALDAYTAQQQRLGRNIRIDAITGVLRVAGVQYADVTKPTADIELDDSEASRCTSTTLTNGGPDA